jgi:hypothetical protein
MVTVLPASTAARASLTTWSLSSQSAFGRADMSISARSWNSVCTNPGHTAVAVTPEPVSSTDRPSVKTVTHDLIAE